jgi:hypothetical protein
MTKTSRLFVCVVVVTASLAFAQQRSAHVATPQAGSRATVTNGSGSLPCSVIHTSTKCTNATPPSGGPTGPTSTNGTPSASGISGQGKSRLGRAMSRSLGEDVSRPGTPDFVNSSSTGSAQW